MIIDGKLVSENIKNLIADKIENEVSKPSLTVIQVGDNPASSVYVKNKNLTAAKLGIVSNTINLSDNVKEDVLLDIIDSLNKDESIDGILVQLPLPKHIDENRVLESINPDKDVDGFHPLNVGKLNIGREEMIPATPAGIIELLNYYNIDIEGKHAVIIGRSNIVGKPMAHLLLKNNATVTIAHSKTKNLKDLTKLADILVVAIGKPNFIKKEDIKENAVVIDVGINRINNKLIGDVDFEDVKEKASFITPVPGGVGPMTIAMLMKQTYNAYLNHKH